MTRTNALKTHCPEGHEYANENLYVTPSGWRQCRACRTTLQRRWMLKRRYGVTPEEYDAMRLKQGGACAICNTTTKLDVDHDHSTGQIRGLLCRNCNVAIGLVRDNPATLDAAAEYLRMWR